MRISDWSSDVCSSDLTRAKIRLAEQAAKSEIIKLPAHDGAPERRIGVVKLPAFYQDFEGRRKNSDNYASATRDVARLPKQFKAQGSKEERRVGKEWVSTCRYRWSQEKSKKKKK